MGLLDWFRRRKKKPKEEEAPPIDEEREEREALERTRKLQTEIEEHMAEKPKRAKRKRKKESA